MFLKGVLWDTNSDKIKPSRVRGEENERRSETFDEIFDRLESSMGLHAVHSGCLDTDELLMEMFQYIADHPKADYQELYEVTCRIAEREGLLEDE